VALEMAQQLRAEGERVELLALFGSAPPGFERERGYMWERLAYHRKQGRLLSVLLFYLRVKIAKIPRKMRRRWRFLRRAMLGKLPTQSGGQITADVAPLPSYVPQSYPGRITLFDSTAATRDAWSKLAQEGVECKVIEGTHHDLFQEPLVGELAAELGGCLDRVLGGAVAA
jgi:thioesterase domain-containing protein